MISYIFNRCCLHDVLRPSIQFTKELNVLAEVIALPTEVWELAKLRLKQNDIKVIGFGRQQAVMTLPRS